MKKIITAISFLSLFLVLLVSCGTGTKITIEGSMDITIYKTSILVETSFVDSEAGEVKSEQAKAYIILSNEDDEQVNRKNVVIDTEKMTGTALSFDNLTVDTEYTVKLFISLNGSQKTLQSKTIVTKNNGETADDPIPITNKNELIAMSKDVDAYYILENDIDLGAETLTSIFNSSSVFSGNLDGNGFTISNFELESNTYSGLFGYMKGATIKNLTLDTITYNNSRGDTSLGALSGRAERCTLTDIVIKNVNFTHSGTTTKTPIIGGFVGNAVDCVINNVQVEKVNLSITRAQLYSHIGGFVGQNNGSLIEDCSVTGDITATIVYSTYENGFTYLGGFAGVNDSSKGIHNSYANVNITLNESSSSKGYETHSTYVGGFVGGNIHQISRIYGCVAIGEMKTTIALSYNVHVGGLVGKIVHGANIQNCAYIPTKEGLTVDLMKPNDENEIPQTSYLSLTIAKHIEAITLVNVFTYTDSMTIIQAETSNAIITPYEVGRDISCFKQTIQDLINSVLQA